MDTKIEIGPKKGYRFFIGFLIGFVIGILWYWNYYHVDIKQSDKITTAESIQSTNSPLHIIPYYWDEATSTYRRCDQCCCTGFWANVINNAQNWFYPIQQKEKNSE